MWTDVAKDITGKLCEFEANGVRTPATVETAAAGTAFMKIDLRAVEAQEPFSVTGYLPQMQLGVDDVAKTVTVRQLSRDWILHFDRDVIGETQ